MRKIIGKVKLICFFFFFFIGVKDCFRRKIKIIENERFYIVGNESFNIFFSLRNYNS